MKTTDFAYWLSHYLTTGLLTEQNASPRTVESYRYAFIQYLDYMEAKHGIHPDDLSIKDFNEKTVIGFLDWLKNERNNSVPSRNQRLAALKGFSRYLRFSVPSFEKSHKAIQDIPTEKVQRKDFSYLSDEAVQLLMKQVNLNTTYGLRDLLVILFLYTAGIRVSELIELKVKDISFHTPPTLKVRGRNEKPRSVPISKTVLPYLREYLKQIRIGSDARSSEPLFTNHSSEPFTRQGINYLVKKYAAKAHEADPALIPKDINPQKLRHTMAMKMVSSGAPLNYVKDILGHTCITTTQVYARAEAKLREEAKEPEPEQETVAAQENAPKRRRSIKEWLKSFNRK